MGSQDSTLAPDVKVGDLALDVFAERLGNGREKLLHG